MPKMTVETTNLNLDSLGMIGGGVTGVLLEKLISQAAYDLQDRGDDGKTRKINITVNLTQSKAGTVDVNVEANCKLPNYVTPVTGAKTQYNHSDKRWAVVLPTEDVADNDDSAETN